MFPTPGAPALSTSKGFRADIQGLRAVAVVLVVVFHLFPQTLTGGYVGVDVFFVISGFLITGLLVRRSEAANRVDFKDFYIRRARRLLPAACTVIVATALAGLVILPRTQWAELGRDALASAFYVENYLLYMRNLDYLAADAAPSPLQHYWSLSVEEQFYIIWPLVIAAGLWVAGRLGARARPILFGLLFALAAASFASSVLRSASDPGAYFLTGARIWELALGGLLALAGPALSLKPSARLVLRWLGLAMILVSGVMFSGGTVFPGYAAALPTMGTVFLLLPTSGTSFDPARLLETRPAQYLGDISYSLYLWHWPVIILGAVWAGGTLAPWQLVVATIVMLVLSHATKFGIEDRFRHMPKAGRPGRRTLGLSAVSLGATAIAAGLLLGPTWLKDQTPVLTAEDLGDYPGAMVLLDGAPSVPAREPIPAIEGAVRDFPELYAKGCQVTFDSVDPLPCEWGDPNGTTTIVLAGDSHAAMYLPALRAWADGKPVRIITQTKSSCAFISETVMRGTPYAECREWNENLLEDLLADPPDLVITSKIRRIFVADRPDDVSNDEAVASALLGQWRPLLDAGIPVLVITEGPRFPDSRPDCLATPGRSVDECTLLRDEAYAMVDQTALAASQDPRVRVANISDGICLPDTCPPIIGNVLVYRDAHHLTATYARTLRDHLGPELDAALGGAAP